MLIIVLKALNGLSSVLQWPDLSSVKSRQGSVKSRQGPSAFAVRRELSCRGKAGAPSP